MLSSRLALKAINLGDNLFIVLREDRRQQIIDINKTE